MGRKRIAALAMAVVATVGFMASQSYASLITNGSFESGTYSFGSDGGQDLSSGSTVITGWTIITNDVAPLQAGNIYGNSPEDGIVSLDLQSYNDGSPYGGMQQSIATVAGSRYQLSFWIGVQNSVSYSVGPAAITATAGTTSGTFTNTLSAAGEQWQQFSLPFTATTATTAITLSGASTAGGGYIGLDNVSVVAVPEPASLALLAVASVSLLARRCRNGQVQSK